MQTRCAKCALYTGAERLQIHRRIRLRHPSDLLAVTAEFACDRQAERIAQYIVDTAVDRIESGVERHHGNTMGKQIDHTSSVEITVVDRRHLLENHRVMRDDTVITFLDCLGDHALRDIECTQNTFDLFRTVAAQHQTVIVPSTGQCFRIQSVKVSI